jgi:hypothetical protein
MMRAAKLEKVDYDVDSKRLKIFDRRKSIKIEGKEMTLDL